MLSVSENLNDMTLLDAPVSTKVFTLLPFTYTSGIQKESFKFFQKEADTGYISSSISTSAIRLKGPENNFVLNDAIT